MSRVIIGKVFFFTNDDDTAYVNPQLLGLKLAFQHKKVVYPRMGLGIFDCRLCKKDIFWFGNIETISIFIT